MGSIVECKICGHKYQEDVGCPYCDQTGYDDNCPEEESAY